MYVGKSNSCGSGRQVGWSVSWDRNARMLVGQSAAVGRQVCWSVNQLGLVGRYVGWSNSWGR